MDFTKNLTKPIICYIKDLCNTIDRLQYELSKIAGLVNYLGIGTLKNPVNDIFTKRIKIGEDSIRIDGDEINFDNSGRKITSSQIGTQEKPFETIYVKKIDADNEVDNFTVDGYLTVKGETTLGTNSSTDTTVKGDLTVNETVTFDKTLDVTGTITITEPIVATGITVDSNTWNIRTPIICSFSKEIISNGKTNSIILPKSVGNFNSSEYRDGNVYSFVLSRTDGNFQNSDNPYYFGYLQTSNFDGGKANLIQTVLKNDINSISVSVSNSQIILSVQLSTSRNVDCTISLTQLR